MKLINTQQYDHNDFVQNPNKYMLYRTARIAKKLPCPSRLKVGQVVNIRYYCTAKNHVRGSVDMPIYEVWDNSEEMKNTPDMLYACALKDFAL